MDSCSVANEIEKKKERKEKHKRSCIEWEGE